MSAGEVFAAIGVAFLLGGWAGTLWARHQFKIGAWSYETTN